MQNSKRTPQAHLYCSITSGVEARVHGWVKTEGQAVLYCHMCLTARAQASCCDVYCRKTPTALKKLGERSERGRLMGREPGTKGWRVLLDSGGIVIRYICIFVEVAAEDGGDDADDDSDYDNSSTQSAAGESDGGEDAVAAAEPEVEEAERAEKAPAQAQAPFKRVLPERRREPSKVLRDSYDTCDRTKASAFRSSRFASAVRISASSFAKNSNKSL